MFDAMYATVGRRSVPPETLLKSTVLMAMYSIRSERAFCERLNYDLLFKWFLDMRIDQPAFDATTFTKNRKRLLEHEVADEFFAAVVRQAKLRRYISSEHFSVDGTLLKAWASHKSFKPKDGPPSEPPAGRNVEVQWHGEKRSNDTHASTTDPEARLYRKSNNTAATLCYAGHLLMEHRSRVDRRRRAHHRRRLRGAGHRARDARPASQSRRGDARSPATRATTPRVRRRRPRARVHAARRPEHERNQRSAIDGRTTRHPGHAVSAADPQTDRGTLRLDQDHRRRTQAALHRPTTQPGLVQDHRRRLQPDPHHRPRHHNPPDRRPPGQTGAGPDRGRNTKPSPQTPAIESHQPNRRSPPNRRFSASC